MSCESVSLLSRESYGLITPLGLELEKATETLVHWRSKGHWRTTFYDLGRPIKDTALFGCFS